MQTETFSKVQHLRSCATGGYLGPAVLDRRPLESGGRKVTQMWPQPRGEGWNNVSGERRFQSNAPRLNYDISSSCLLLLLLLSLSLRLSSAKPLAPVIMDGKKQQEDEDDEDKQYVVEEAAPPPADAPELDVVSVVISRLLHCFLAFFCWNIARWLHNIPLKSFFFK